MLLFCIGTLTNTKGSALSENVAGSEYAAGVGIALITSFVTFLYSIIHVCCRREAGKIHIFLCLCSIAMYVCSIGSVFGGEESFVDAMCTQSVNCLNVGPFDESHCGDKGGGGVKLCYTPDAKDPGDSSGAYFSSWWLDDCWDGGGDDNICRVFDTKEECKKYNNFGTTDGKCTGITHDELFEWLTYFTGIPQVVCIVFILVNIFTHLCDPMSPARSKELDEFQASMK